jgi:hypothetical protein
VVPRTIARQYLRHFHCAAVVCECIRDVFMAPLRSGLTFLAGGRWLVNCGGPIGLSPRLFLSLAGLFALCLCWPLLVPVTRRCLVRHLRSPMKRVLQVGCRLLFVLLALALAFHEPANFAYWILAFGFAIEFGITTLRSVGRKGKAKPAPRTGTTRSSAFTPVQRLHIGRPTRLESDGSTMTFEGGRRCPHGLCRSRSALVDRRARNQR